MTHSKGRGKPKKPPQYLDAAERKALLQVISDPQDRAMFVLAMGRGLRASELGLLRVEDFTKRTKRLFIRRLKGSISQDYALTSRELRALQSWLRVRGRVPGPLFPGYNRAGIGRRQLDRLMKRYGTMAGLPPHKQHMHALKHTCATMLIDEGAELTGVQDHLGHAHVSSTMQYIHTTERQREDVLAKLERAA